VGGTSGTSGVGRKRQRLCRLRRRRSSNSRKRRWPACKPALQIRQRSVGALGGHDIAQRGGGGGLNRVKHGSFVHGSNS
jgi:hypothetical protein